MVAALPRSYGLRTQLRRERGKEGKKKKEKNYNHAARVSSATSCSCKVMQINHNAMLQNCRKIVFPSNFRGIPFYPSPPHCIDEIYLSD